jgi:hypothetical protein
MRSTVLVKLQLAILGILFYSRRGTQIIDFTNFTFWSQWSTNSLPKSNQHSINSVPTFYRKPTFQLFPSNFRLFSLNPAQPISYPMYMHIYPNSDIPSILQMTSFSNYCSQACCIVKYAILGPTPGSSTSSLSVGGMSSSYFSCRMSVVSFMYLQTIKRKLCISLLCLASMESNLINKRIDRFLICCEDVTYGKSVSFKICHSCGCNLVFL